MKRGAGPLGQAEVAPSPLPRSGKAVAALALLKADRLATLTDIARIVGLTRERVRQIAELIGETGRQRQKRRPKKLPAHNWPGLKDGGKWLVWQINKWLAPAEFYCSWCRRACPIEKKASHSTYCQPCVNQRVCAYLKTPAGKAYKAQYEQTEQRRAYLRRRRKRRTAREGR